MRTSVTSGAPNLATVRTVGGVLPADLLARVVAGADLPGLSADDYRLELGVTPREAANRAWSVLHGAWTTYRDALAARPEGNRATGLTRDKWLAILLRELGFGTVPATPAGGIEVDGRPFPISHRVAGNIPVHLLGWKVDLDRRSKGVAGAAERPPHAMVQELLNRSGDYLWGLLSNGATLRLLRDSSSLVGQSYVEFDLEAMFEGEVFSDFVVLFLICHHSRFEPAAESAGLEDCWLERWRSHAAESGTRALGALRVGVRRAIEVLGTGFLQHADNAALRKRLEPGGDITLADYHRGLLRLAYRLLFCFVAEDRGLLLAPDAPGVAKERYTDWFSTSRLRRVATRRRGTRHHDLWEALSLVLDGLGREGGLPQLALPGLGGLFEPGPADVTTGYILSNDALLEAVRHLAIIQPAGGGPKRLVDYRHLGAEELGGIYESLLEFVPRYDPATRSFTLESVVGNERKTSGAYYTPAPLIDSLLDSALDPLLDEAEKSDDPEAALLALTVCDPACGSGHFLVAAARRIAARLARVRAGDAEPSVLDAQAAMHDVVGRCIYGVDLNPMAAELAKVSLWLEALQPGRPLSFLDAHIKVGNALLGTVPALLTSGIPDDAFATLEGDDKKTVSALKKRNKTERDGQGDLFASAGIQVDNRAFADAAMAVDAIGGLSLADVTLARQRQRELDSSPGLCRARLLADAWCAAFVIERRPGLPELTQAVLERWQSIDLDGLTDDPVFLEVKRLSALFKFFHWHLEFPHVFRVVTSTADGPGWTGGFSCVLGNPPWEHVELKEQEFFAARDPEIAGASGEARKKLIRSLAQRNPGLDELFRFEKRRADAERHLLGRSGRYPLCGRGRINTYAVFAETDQTLLSPSGRLGMILPAGIATDATTRHFFSQLVTDRSLAVLLHFENEDRIFATVTNRFHFVLLTISGTGHPVDAAQFDFCIRHLADVRDHGRRFTLSAEEIMLLNPNTGTCPLFRTRRDAEIALSIYQRVPVLRHHRQPERGWAVSFMQGLFNMATDSGLFRSRTELEDAEWELDGNLFRHNGQTMLPLYEAKMIHHFDHRWGSYEHQTQAQANKGILPRLSQQQRDDPNYTALPRYWVSESEVQARVGSTTTFTGFRDACRTTDERTVIAATIPRAAVGHKLPLVLTASKPHLLNAVFSSLVFDYLARQKVGGASVAFFIVEQLPAPPPEAFNAPAPWDADLTIGRWMEPRIIELTWTAWDMEPFARDLGDTGPPFGWDDERRAVLRAELDAAFFHIYGLDRGDTAHVLSTFPVLNRNDEGRTRLLVLDCYERLAKAIVTGEPYLSSLDPLPGQGSRHSAR